MPPSKSLQYGVLNSLATSIPGAQAIYSALMGEPFSQKSRSLSRDYLKQKLNQIRQLPCDLPLQPDAMTQWIEREAMAVGEDYAKYLAARRAGQPRRYFSCRSHALSFLQRVAPTKLVDGAWLYGVLQHWRNHRFYSLIRTYLEELGDGDVERNHVAVYQRLLAENGCEILPELSDEHYVQGVLQLALGYHADEFMPELIGYNLGYEQLPLHLLITAFELNELRIDPHYFTLHVTIDNASSGHARKAVQSVLGALPVTGDSQPFLERLANGYRLNRLGLSANAIINAFDLELELVAMLERKSVFGRHVHSDFCRIGGRTVNEWLARPDRIRGFLEILEGRGWIKRHTDPKHSRFWRLVDGPDAQMFGVFSPFEKQLLHDWIAGDGLKEVTENFVSTAVPSDLKTFRRHRTLAAGKRVPNMERSRKLAGDIDHDTNALSHELGLLPEAARMQRLIKLMAPSTHATPTGLLATRLFSAALG
jgi:hypothetical protein